MTENELLKYLSSEGYNNLRVLEEGIIGTIDMIFTRALVIDINEGGYGHRYCYPDRMKADLACAALQHLDDEPLSGYVAIKGLKRDSSAEVSNAKN